MNHQLNSFSWDVLGPTLCLPQAVSHAGWVLTNVEARSASGSSESLSSNSSAGTLNSSNNFVEDVLCQSFFDDGFHSPVSFTTGPEDTVDFDFNFLPSSPESIDFMHLDGSGVETLPLDLENVSDMLMDKSSNTIKIFPTPENIKVEQAVEDPDVALKLLRQLSTDHINNDVSINLADPPSVRNHSDARFISLNVLPVDDASFIPSQTLAASPAFGFTSVAPANIVSFRVDNFFANPHDSHHKTTPPVNTVLVSSQNSSSFTLRDLVSMPDVRQVSLAPSPVVSRDGAFVTMDSISFEDIVVPQQSNPLVIRPEKRQRKKEQNKNAAQKYRQKKRVEQGSFLSECQETEKKNSELKLRVNEITREINYLKGLLLEISVA